MFLVVFSTILYLILVEREPFQLTCALQETEKVTCPHFGNPTRRKVINHVRLKSKEVKATAEERKEEYMVEAENPALWRLGFALIKVLPGPSRIFSGPGLLVIAKLGKSNINSDWAQARMCWASTVQAPGLIRVVLKPYFSPTFATYD